ncbi:AAA domain-containing protein [Xanthomonas sp. WHRI 8391]|uniref:RecBCD enzyme subunit RecD n=1 Tax=Xanthomonas hortorum pv. carotae TaxID=487904 RepID=A0A6V7DGH4_9XANT|nr:AAA domain-containing protein [Xanthomonas hortorum]ETC87981.1 ATP-binding protein [Xanthomonas hortorum pv. carotae str. M081]UTS72414.1 AAA domain-containing protein [Xanthomonas hortorum]CAD0334058.1 RecBCD enzyme subunit RecD [Xanthomonas hortorum pv. carotae]CAD0334068.1 RecBCD enzyme subunit RecD [Xanthomonas hortorum pv. carotae]
MVSIHVDGEDKTAKISDWVICWSDKYKALQLTCHYPSKKTYTRPLSNCCVSPSRELGEMLLTKPTSTIVKPVSKVTIYGERYAVVHYPDANRPYVHKMDGIGLVAPTAIKDTPIFHYFLAVANARRDCAKSETDREIAANVVRQLERLPASADTALQAYCTGRNGALVPSRGLIYPFGLNESQLAAVEQAFRAQVSVIEGPPGTGKTQTILNILANILLRGQTVAVLSNNNAAVENVYEKLEKCGLGHLVAKLGNQDNRRDFFADLAPWPPIESEPAPSLEEIQVLLDRLKQHLHDRNRVAQLQVELDELTVERRYLQQWQAESGVQVAASLDKYGLSPPKTTDLMAYLAYLGEQRIRLKDRIELLFQFKIFRTKPFADGDARLTVFHALQMHYYDKALRDKEAELQKCRDSLALANFDVSLEALKAASMRHLKQHLQAQVRPLDSFNANTYRHQQQFDAFLQRFPILGSGTHSIVNSIASGAILDYVIIDEASLQNIVPGILPLGCAKNLIVVGDNRQLAHIPVVLDLPAPADAYDCERYSLLDSCIKVFGAAIPRTMLKEHYRCHPRIIQFCNQQFYDNALIPMTEDKGEAPLRLVVTARGNHTRKNTNLRELDSLLKLLDDEGDPVGMDHDGRGFIAPFRAQVNLSGRCLPEDFVKDTVHKFQGRECDEIVFSTVLDKKRYNQQRERLDFVDDPHMINVAVSRAKHRFTLVTGDEVFTGNNGQIAALVRYVTYYAQDEQILRAPVVSAFDLLYREYDHSLARLNARLRPEDSRYKSEQIVAQLLREALSASVYRSLMYHDQIKLDQVASPNNPDLTQRERAFMARASCDFVIYFKVGKVPLGVIEVDGGSHDRPDQAARDALKNGILAKSGIPILRLSTIKSGIAESIDDFIAQWAGAPRSA